MASGYQRQVVDIIAVIAPNGQPGKFIDQAKAVEEGSVRLQVSHCLGSRAAGQSLAALNRMCAGRDYKQLGDRRTSHVLQTAKPPAHE
jgi:hypothetical protein